MTAQILKKVQKGVRFLNKRNPGWYKKIKLTELNMGGTYDCILGQLYCNFPIGVEHLGLTFINMEEALTKAAPYGFSITSAMTDRLNKKDAKLVDKLYKQYTNIWKAEIHKLRKVI